ncbi:DUF1120 domain-containing protein [Burkholderia cenocepacia]|uniref:DUF1120 domain-containing protein n=1 Tax=Burkholderia cenocepacia TaxID=95486 RepID=UPI0028611197|nr:DUF1120 domain-containing protein [Burkholderia cenocepacia]MDR8047990.1 DUF1120 domain-containing protein [Burkholderia cenocepacia]
MKISFKYIIFALSLGTSVLSTTAHAQSMELKVTGTIKPSSCDVDLVGGAKFDLGKIKAEDLNSNARTPLTALSKTINITCDSPTKIAFSAIDNKSESVPYEYEIETPARFGLGKTTGDKKIGFYNITFKDVTLDTTDVDHYIHSGDNGTSWIAGTGGDRGYARTDRWISFAATSADQPAEIESLSGQLSIEPTIVRSTDLPQDDVITLEGSATLELRYL